MRPKAPKHLRHEFPTSYRIPWTPERLMPWREDPTPDQRAKLRQGIADFRAMLERAHPPKMP